MQSVIEIRSLAEKRGYRVIDNLDVVGESGGTAYQGYRPRGKPVVLSRPGADGSGRGAEGGFGVDCPGGVDLVLGVSASTTRGWHAPERKIMYGESEGTWARRGGSGG